MGIRETTYCSECLRPKDERIAELEQRVEALTEAIQNWYDNGYDRREAERLLATAQQEGT